MVSERDPTSMSRPLSPWACLLLACGICFGQSSSGPVDTEWRNYGHDPGGARFSSLNQINTANVEQRQRAWTYQIAPAPNSGIEALETTPLMVEGVLYFTTQTSRAIAVDAESG